jgi:hypothetical protein
MAASGRGAPRNRRLRAREQGDERLENAVLATQLRAEEQAHIDTWRRAVSWRRVAERVSFIYHLLMTPRLERSSGLDQAIKPSSH